MKALEQYVVNAGMNAAPGKDYVNDSRDNQNGAASEQCNRV